MMPEELEQATKRAVQAYEEYARCIPGDGNRSAMATDRVAAIGRLRQTWQDADDELREVLRRHGLEQ